MPEDDLSLSRPPTPGRQTAEVRVDLPIRLVAVLDAITIRRDKSRTAVVTEWLTQRLEREIDDATLIVKLAGSNPTSGD